jgi:hypothetical protein
MVHESSPASANARPAAIGQKVSGLQRQRTVVYGFAVVGIVLATIASSVAILMPSRNAKKVSENDPIGKDRMVALDPDEWKGRTLPIAAHIDVGSTIQSGRWLVVLWSHSCPHCIEALEQYESLAGQLTENDARCAFIEIPPFGPQVGTHRKACLSGKLSPNYAWFAAAPITVVLVNGTVEHAWEGNVPAEATVLACFR